MLLMQLGRLLLGARSKLLHLDWGEPSWESTHSPGAATALPKVTGVIVTARVRLRAAAGGQAGGGRVFKETDSAGTRTEAIPRMQGLAPLDLKFASVPIICCAIKGTD